MVSKNRNVFCCWSIKLFHASDVFFAQFVPIECDTWICWNVLTLKSFEWIYLKVLFEKFPTKLIMLEIFEVYWKGLLPNQSYVGNLFWKVLKFVGKICQLPQGSIGKSYRKSQLDLKFSNRSKTWEYLLEATIAFFFQSHSHN